MNPNPGPIEPVDPESQPAPEVSGPAPAGGLKNAPWQTLIIVGVVVGVIVIGLLVKLLG